MSGLAPLVLTKHDVLLIEQHYKETLRSLQRLHSGTPSSVTYFLAGSLPGTALLHLRQLTLFGMISRLPENILHSHAKDIFTSTTLSKKSWFFQIRDLCLCYGLPHPLDILSNPLSKEKFKTMVKSSVIDYWEQKLRGEASNLSSLQYFKPSFMSLTSPHPLWTTAGSSPSMVAMATVQAQLLSGRYRSQQLCSHWTPHASGCCLLSSSCSTTIEDLPHILSRCVALLPIREKLLRFTLSYCERYPIIKEIVLIFCQPSHPEFCQFLLDCSVMPQVILANQLHGKQILHHLFLITRTWTYNLHKERMKILGRWNIF